MVAFGCGFVLRSVVREKVVVSWSGGKDSTFALYKILKTQNYRILKLLTTVAVDLDRISVHGVRRVLLERQAVSLGFPLETMLVPTDVSDMDYERRFVRSLEESRVQGALAVVFGDIFLEDLKEYRVKLLLEAGLKRMFPLWGCNTWELARNFINAGFKAIVSLVDSRVLGEEFVGRKFDKVFLSDLPSGVDPCGENGEFHTFVYDGPIFRRRVNFVRGKVTLNESRFFNCDLVPYVA